MLPLSFICSKYCTADGFTGPLIHELPWYRPIGRFRPYIPRQPMGQWKNKETKGKVQGIPKKPKEHPVKPSGNLLHSYGKSPFIGDFPMNKWWFSIVVLVYQRGKPKETDKLNLSSNVQQFTGTLATLAHTYPIVDDITNYIPMAHGYKPPWLCHGVLSRHRWQRGITSSTTKKSCGQIPIFLGLLWQ